MSIIGPPLLLVGAIGTAPKGDENRTKTLSLPRRILEPFFPKQRRR